MEFRELEDDKLEDEGKVLRYINDIFTLEFSVSEGTYVFQKAKSLLVFTRSKRSREFGVLNAD